MNCNCNGVRVVQVQIPGAQGPKGDPGADGADGKDGIDGKPGITPSIEVEAVTLDADSQATVQRTGSDDSPKFTFGIPRGRDGSSSVDSIDSASINNLF